jgi:arylsulfatase A-like enzyme
VTLNRRNFLVLSGAGLLAAGAAPPARRPNIVFILADDLGYGDLGSYGQTRIRTPHLDRMAAEGVRFTQHYAGTSVCAPSRCCLLTGRHTGHGAIRGNGPDALADDPKDPTIFRLLKDAGYRTALIGKSGLSGNIDDGAHPNRKGVDHFFGFVSHAAAHRHYPESLYRNGERVAYPGNRGKEGDSYGEAAFVAEAERFLTESRDRPFFLHYAPTLPHADLAVPDEWRRPYAGRFPETPFAGGHYRAEPQPLATYAGMVAYLDNGVGRLLAKLKELGVERETLVLFASDNGAMREGGYDPAYLRSSGPLRGGKRDLYEGGIRSPLIARWPGRIKAGTTSDHVSAFWDFPATACELAGLPTPPGTDGISYLPALLGDTQRQRRHDYLYWELHEQGGKRAVRVGGWKMVQLGAKKDPDDGPVEVYDLRADPAEKTDLSARHPEKVAEARRLFRRAHTPKPGFDFVGGGDAA